MELKLSGIISGLSYALDLTEGQPPGHCVRCCWIGTHVAKNFGITGEELWDIYYTLLLKDAGCSSNAARLCELYGSDDHLIKKDWKTVDDDQLAQVARFILSHTGLKSSLSQKFEKILKLVKNGHSLAKELIQTRCERGANIAKKLGFNDRVAQGIQSLDEHWNGKGKPLGLKENDIPLSSQIALLSQVADVFFKVSGKSASINEIKKRANSWFNPKLVDAFLEAASNDEIWTVLDSKDIENQVHKLEPSEVSVDLNEDRLDAIAEGFGEVVDAKSPYTSGHSFRVAKYSNLICKKLELSKERTRWLYRGALLHDLGKLAVSNSILDKPDKLDQEEWEVIKSHPFHTEEILKRIGAFDELAEVAGAHHERLDGAGYYKGLPPEKITRETRIITTADIFDALSADRPYRGAMPLEKALSIMQEMRGTALDPECLDALVECVSEMDPDNL